jgi:ankyrin repeat protein
MNKADVREMTPLHIAAQLGKLNFIQLLLDADADVDALDVNKYSALHWAAANNHVATAEKLAAAGTSATNCSKAIALARDRGHFNVVDAIEKARPISQVAN